MKNKKFVLFLPIILLVLIFGISCIPNLGNIPLTRPLLFKIIAHISAFAVFTFSLIAAVIELSPPKAKKPDFLKTLLLTATIAFLCALLTECCQVFIASRGANLRDIGFDTIGILLAVGTWHLVTIKKKRKKRII